MRQRPGGRRHEFGRNSEPCSDKKCGFAAAPLLVQKNSVSPRRCFGSERPARKRARMGVRPPALPQFRYANHRPAPRAPDKANRPARRPPQPHPFTGTPPPPPGEPPDPAEPPPSPPRRPAPALLPQIARPLPTPPPIRPEARPETAPKTTRDSSPPGARRRRETPANHHPAHPTHHKTLSPLPAPRPPGGSAPFRSTPRSHLNSTLSRSTPNSARYIPTGSCVA